MQEPTVNRSFSHGRFLAGLVTAFLILLALAEGFCRWASYRGFWYERMNPVVDLTSRPEVEDRLHWAFQHTQPLFLLGDSVLGPTAMMQARVPDARKSSLAACLQNKTPAGTLTVNLGSDGLLLPDLEALAGLLSKGRTEGVFIVLNFRMFAPEFKEGVASRSRPFLNEDPAWMTTAAEKTESALLRHSFLFRTSRLLRTLWYHPNQKDFFQRLLEQALNLHGDPDIQHAALVRKVASYYPPQTWDPKAAPFLSLQTLLNRLGEKGIPTLVVLTPQNPSFLGDRFEPAPYQANRRLLAELMGKYARPGLRFFDWADRLPQDLFLDHCHLTPEGNQRLAHDLWTEWNKFRHGGPHV